MPDRPQISDPIFLLSLLTFFVSLTVTKAFTYLAFPVVPIIEPAALTCCVVFGLILFTIWARKRGHDVCFLAHLLLPCTIGIQLSGLIQLCFPQWRVFTSLCNGFVALGCCVCIVYCSSRLMQHSSSDDIILVILLFFAIVCLLFRFIDMEVVLHGPCCRYD